MSDNKIECFKNSIMQEDVEKIVEQFPFISDLQGKNILVTGATGLIGSQLIMTLACFNRLKAAHIKILACARNKEKAEKMFQHLVARGDVKLIIGDVNYKLEVEDRVDYIIHGASATSSKYFVSNPVETIRTAIDGTFHVLELAKEKDVQSMVYLSSLEVYGTPSLDADMITEKDYGYIDPVNVRSSYSEGKRMVECMCVAYANEYQVPVKMARLSQTFGPGVDYHDGRVFMEFARCALEKKNIVLHTQGRTIRTYCYVKDAVNALLYILLCGNRGEAYNVTNMHTAVSIREMADMVCKTIGQGQIKTVIDIPEDVASFGYNPEMVIRLDAAKLESLGWKATVGLQEMFERMINVYATGDKYGKERNER